MPGNLASGDTLTTIPTSNQPTASSSQFLRYMTSDSSQVHGALNAQQTTTGDHTLSDMPSHSSRVHGAANNQETTSGSRDLPPGAADNQRTTSSSHSLRDLSSGSLQVHGATNNQHGIIGTQTLGSMASSPSHIQDAANYQHTTTGYQASTNMASGSSRSHNVAHSQRTATTVPTTSNPVSSNSHRYIAAHNQRTATSDQTSNNIALGNLQAHIAAHNQGASVGTQVSSDVPTSGSRTQGISDIGSESTESFSTILPSRSAARRTRNLIAAGNQSAASRSHMTMQASAGPSSFGGYVGEMRTTPWTSSNTMDPFIASHPVRGASSPSLLAFNANQRVEDCLPDFRRFPMQLTPGHINQAPNEQQQVNQFQYGQGFQQEEDSQLPLGAQRPSVHQLQPAARQHTGTLQLPRSQQPHSAQRPMPVFFEQQLGPQGYPQQLTATPYGLPVPSVPPPLGAPPTVPRYHQYAPASAAAPLPGPAVFNTAWSNTVGQPAIHHGAGAPVLNPLPYRAGSSAMYPQPAVAGTSVRLQLMTRGGNPPYEMAMGTNFLPFQQTAWEAAPVGWGVVRVTNVSRMRRRRWVRYQ